MKTELYVVEDSLGGQTDPLTLRKATAVLREWDAIGAGPCKRIPVEQPETDMGSPYRNHSVVGDGS